MGLPMIAQGAPLEDRFLRQLKICGIFMAGTTVEAFRL
jgi:hypothetical protein